MALSGGCQVSMPESVHSSAQLMMSSIGPALNLCSHAKAVLCQKNNMVECSTEVVAQL